MNKYRYLSVYIYQTIVMSCLGLIGLILTILGNSDIITMIGVGIVIGSIVWSADIYDKYSNDPVVQYLAQEERERDLVGDEPLYTCRDCGFVRTPLDFSIWVDKYHQAPSDDGEQICDSCIEDGEDGIGDLFY